LYELLWELKTFGPHWLSFEWTSPAESFFKYYLLYSAEHRKLYGFGTTQEWANNDNLNVFSLMFFSEM